MALARQITNQPLLSSPPCLPRASGSNARGVARQPPFLGQSCCLTLRASARSCAVVRASSSAQAEPKSGGGEGDGGGEEPYEEYEVEILKPYGLKFAKGRDGGTYIEAIFPGSSAEQTGKFTPGDKVLATSAVFGEEIWPAAGYGQTMYCIRQRVGPLYMKMQKKFGKWDSGELSEKEIIRAERNTGNVSTKLREIQMQNYQKKMEQKIQREDDLRSGLRLYKDGKYEEALDKFESVLGSKPEIDESSVASYNVACCYSKLDRIQAGLSALEDAMKAGYEDFKQVLNCGFHSWIDEQEWPDTMKNALTKLWGMYQEAHSGRIKDNYENSLLVKQLSDEKQKIEKKYQSLMDDVKKFMDASERQVLEANYKFFKKETEAAKNEGETERKLLEVTNYAAALKNEVEALKKAKEDLKNLIRSQADILKANKEKSKAEKAVLMEKTEAELAVLQEKCEAEKGEKKKVEYMLFDLFQACSALKDKVKMIKDICEK